MRSSVVLPQPDGPEQREELAAGGCRGRRRRRQRTLPKLLRDVAQCDDSASLSPCAQSRLRSGSRRAAQPLGEGDEHDGAERMQLPSARTRAACGKAQLAPDVDRQRRVVPVRKKASMNSSNEMREAEQQARDDARQRQRQRHPPEGRASGVSPRSTRRFLEAAVEALEAATSAPASRRACRSGHGRRDVEQRKLEAQTCRSTISSAIATMITGMTSGSMRKPMTPACRGKS